MSPRSDSVRIALDELTDGIDVLHRRVYDLESKLECLTNVAAKLTDELRTAANQVIADSTDRRRTSVVGVLVSRVERLEQRCDHNDAVHVQNDEAHAKILGILERLEGALKTLSAPAPTVAPAPA